MFEKQYKEFGKKKVYFFTALILIVINIIIVFFSYQSKLRSIKYTDAEDVYNLRVMDGVRENNEFIFTET